MATLTTAAKSASEIPGDLGLPLIGHSFELLLHMDRFVHGRYARYGEVSKGNAFGMNVISLLGPDAHPFVFQNRRDLFQTSAWEALIAPLSIGRESCRDRV